MLTIVIMLVCAAIILIAVAVIMWVRGKRNLAVSKLQTLDDRDFLERIVDKKRAKLGANPWGMKLRTYLTIGIVSAVALGAGSFLMSGKMQISAIATVIGLLIPEFVESMRSGSEKAKFEERYARALRQLSSSLKSGMSISQAVEDITISPFIHDSIRTEFMQIDSDLKLGLSVHEAFVRFAKNVNTHDAADVAIAISMQQQVGGNTTLVVETITNDINARIMNRKETKSLFAGTSSTITIMDFLPLGILAFLWVSTPSYFQPFFETPVLTAVFWGLICFTLIGSWVVRKTVKNMKKDCGV